MEKEQKFGKVLKKSKPSKARPTVVIDTVIHSTIKAIHEHAKRKNKEWSCYCRMIKKEGEYHLIDMKFPEQTNSKAHTKITEKGK